MRAFMLVRKVETEIEGVDYDFSRVEFINANGPPFDTRFILPEIRSFLDTAATGDVFQVQHDEHIVALGEMTKASWLR